MKEAFHDKCMHILVDFDTSLLDSNDFFVVYVYSDAKHDEPSFTPMGTLEPLLGPMF